jgi:PAS domain S-box-containing protein
MKIKNRLNLNTVISIGAVALIILSLVWSYFEDLKANKNVDLVEELRTVAVERIVLRDDYLLHAEERAKIQWHSKSEAMRRLLDMADQRITGSDDRGVLREARKDFDATFTSFSEFMANHKKKESDGTKWVDLTDTESMLISQTFLKAYSLAHNINKLLASLNQHAARVRKRSIAVVFFFLLFGVAGIVANSTVLNRLLNKRITDLSKGVEILGEGDLAYRIDAQGDDELSALALGANEMAAKLRMSYTTLENLEREIAERKRVEEKLHESEEKYRNLFNNAQVGMFRSRLDGSEVIEVNRAFLDIVGMTPEETLGKASVDLWADPGEREEMVKRLVADGSVSEFEYHMLNKRRGEVRNCLTSLRLYPEQGLLEGTILDITERKRAEEEKRNLERQMQQAQKLESLGVLAGGIAHDFNNILMAVLGHAELALEGISPMSPARDNLTEITTAARRAADLCRQMLAYAGKSSFALERLDLRELVEEMAHLLKTTISKKAILNMNLERELPPIQADPSQIRQIVMNLIINASEAIGERSGVITVAVGATRCDEEYLRKTELREALAPGLYVHIEVTDTGHGMDAETRSRIFEPFFSTKFTGRGLGLAAVLGIVRAHRGAMKVYSEPGKGTTFKILFPALANGEYAALPLEASPMANWRGTGTILLVDDEESLLALGARMLEHLGFGVLTAADGLQAVELYRQRGKEIDMVLMDMTMPHMNGAEAFGELRRLNPDVQVVLASGYSKEDVGSRFAGKKPAGIIQKPYTISKLREALAGLLPKRPDGEG